MVALRLGQAIRKLLNNLDVTYFLTCMIYDPKLCISAFVEPFPISRSLNVFLYLLFLLRGVFPLEVHHILLGLECYIYRKRQYRLLLKEGKKGKEREVKLPEVKT